MLEVPAKRGEIVLVPALFFASKKGNEIMHKQPNIQWRIAYPHVPFCLSSCYAHHFFSSSYSMFTGSYRPLNTFPESMVWVSGSGFAPTFGACVMENVRVVRIALIGVIEDSRDERLVGVNEAVASRKTVKGQRIQAGRSH